MMTGLLFWLLVSAQVLAGASVTAEASRTARTDLRILVDVSGSMRKTDPNNLRTTASALLVDLLPEDADAAIWTFAGNPLSLMPLGPVDETWRRQARYAIPNIHSRGQFTDMQRVLEDATADWRASDSELSKETPERTLLLLTDGVVDVAGGATESARARNAILSEVVPALQAANVAVHTVALSEAADQALLKTLAENTGGRFELAQDANELSRIFLRMFEQSVTRETVLLREGRFTIDAAIDEFTLVAFTPSADSPITLVKPDGTALDGEKTPENVRWRRDAGYVVVTVTEPAAGEWRLEGAEDPGNRVMIVTDLALALEPLPSIMLNDESIRVRFYLTEQGVPITRRDLLEMLEAEVRVGEGMSIAATLDAGGRFEALVPAESQVLEANTEYPLTIRVSAQTFERVVTKRIRVIENPLSLNLTLIGKDDSAAQAGVAMLVNEALVRPDTVRMVLFEHRPEGSTVRILDTGAAPDVEVWQDPGAYSLAIAATAVTRTGRVVQANTEPLTFTVATGDATGAPVRSTPAMDAEPAARPSATVWVLIGLVVVLSALVGWLALRRRGPSQPDSADQALNTDDANATRGAAADALRTAITAAAAGRRAALASLLEQIGVTQAEKGEDSSDQTAAILAREQALLTNFAGIYSKEPTEGTFDSIVGLPNAVGQHTDACLELAANLAANMATNLTAAHPSNDDLKHQLDALEANNARLRAHLEDSERSLQQMTAEYNAAFAHAAATASTQPEAEPPVDQAATREAAESTETDPQAWSEAQSEAQDRSEAATDEGTESRGSSIEGEAISREDIDRLMRDPEDPEP